MKYKNNYKIFCLTLIIILFVCGISFSEEETHTIKYKVKNNPNSGDSMKGVSLPKENIQVPDFVELGEVTSEGSSDIAKGESKDFTIKFKIKKDVPNEGIGTVKVKLKYEEDQCIIPSGEDSIIIEDKDPPNHVTGNVIPGSVNADEPQSVYINAVKTDDWSGVDSEQPVQTLMV